MNTLFYSEDKKSPHYALCKEAYRMFDAHYEDGMPVCMKGIEMDANRRAKATTLPLLVKADNTELVGVEAIAEVAKLMGVDAPRLSQRSTPPPSAATPEPSGFAPLLSPEGPPPVPRQSKQQPEHRPSTFAMVQPMDPTYVLYVDDTVKDVVVPHNGVVQVQSFKLVSATLGHKLPNYLKVAHPSVPDDKRRPMPVLVTCDGMRPTPMYGIVAKDWLKVLCELNGGAIRVA